jgi:type II secretory pathway component PulJ
MRAIAASRMAGFSLVELMVALVVGMIVAGAVLAFTVSSVRANSEYVRAARLAQEMRSINQQVVSELRRAGYDEGAMDYVSNSSATEFSQFSPMLVDNDDPDANCIVYAYDRQPGTPGSIDLDNQEVRAIRRATATVGGKTVGVIEMGESSGTAAPTCGGAGPDYSKYPVGCASSGWCALSDPRAVDVTAFLVDDDGAGGGSHGVQDITATGYTPMQIRELRITLTAGLRDDASISRTLVSNVKVRANCLRALIGNCELSPAP